jgi:hypothetical protein
VREAVNYRLKPGSPGLVSERQGGYSLAARLQHDGPRAQSAEQGFEIGMQPGPAGDALGHDRGVVVEDEPLGHAPQARQAADGQGTPRR